ncbi:rna polymerase iii dna directed -related [Holotrichia oblita]|uniref:Rna polymerase iii dna directed -related n=1 Tax=Holotrichia oblita TaxID=644536 RepID=A0ACB9TB35_HOLOL|nr:rna polymerase iii dna directed -related [Holotrichia oblita]
MSYQCGKVISLVLQERFGDLVESIANYLYKYGPCSLLQLKKQMELPLPKVKEVLAVLLKYSLISIKHPNNTDLYALECNRVLWMLRYPTYIKLIKRKFGGDAEVLLEEILQKGYVNETDLLEITLERLTKISVAATLPSLQEKLNSLVIAKYLINFSSQPEIKEDTVKTDEKDKPMEISTPIKAWTINPDRFHQDLRDDFIVSAFANRFDNNAAELIRVLIQQMYVRTEPWAVVSNPVPIVEVKDLIKKMNNFPQLIAHFDQYVAVLEQDNSKFMYKVGEASGGSFQLGMKHIFTVFAWEICEHIVLEKFDSKSGSYISSR